MGMWRIKRQKDNFWEWGSHGDTSEICPSRKSAMWPCWQAPAATLRMHPGFYSKTPRPLSHFQAMTEHGREVSNGPCFPLLVRRSWLSKPTFTLRILGQGPAWLELSQIYTLFSIFLPNPPFHPHLAWSQTYNMGLLWMSLSSSFIDIFSQAFLVHLFPSWHLYPRGPKLIFRDHFCL